MCTVAMFCFFVVLVHVVLPGLIMEKSGDSLKNMENSYGDLSSIKKLVGLILGKVLDLSRQSFFRSFRKRLMR